MSKTKRKRENVFSAFRAGKLIQKRKDKKRRELDSILKDLSNARPKKWKIKY